MAAGDDNKERSATFLVAPRRVGSNRDPRGRILLGRPFRSADLRKGGRRIAGSSPSWRRDRERRGEVERLKGFFRKNLLLAVVLAALALSVPFQYLVRREVVVGLASEHAHSHAHEHEEHAEGEHEGEEHEEGGAASEAVAGENLIDNYSFEVGTRETIWGWNKRGEEWGAYVFRDESRSFKGFASAAVSSQQSGFVDAGWYMYVGPVPSDHDLVFRGQVRAQDLQGRAYLGITILGEVDEKGQREILVKAYSDDVGGTCEWTPGELRCRVPPGAGIIFVECGIYGKGRAWFDEVSLVVEEKKEGPAEGVNLLRNPSFEEGVNSWHLFLEGSAAPPSYGPSAGWTGAGYSLRVENPAGSDAAAHTGFYQSLCGFSGREGSLLVRGKARGESLASRAWVDVVAFRASGSLGFMVTREFAGSTGWEDFKVRLPLDGQAASLMVRINVEGAGAFLVDELEAVYLPSAQ